MQRRQRSRAVRAAAVTTVAAACVLPFALAGPAHADEPVRIWTDASGPLFASTNLEPGGASTECLTVRYSGRDGTSLRMAATTADGGLARYLDLTIAAGTGGAYGDCSGFTGSEVFSGTLADFSARYSNPSAGLALDTGPAAAAAVSIRITLQLQDDNRAQGKNAESSFVWYALGSGGDPAEPPEVEVPVTGPEPSATLAPSAPGSSARPTPKPASPTPSASQQPTAAPATAGPPAPGGPPAANSGEERSVLARIYDSVADAVTRAAPAVFKGARIPLYLLPLMLLFLLIQNEIDRRDPKLALAPAYADPDLPFDYDPTSPVRA